MKIKELLVMAHEKLNKANIQDSAIQARVLLSYVLKMDKQKLIINSEENVENTEEKQFCNLLEKLIKGKPLQYLTNKQEFMKLEFYVDENVLIPQPDTEILVQQVIKYINQNNYKKVKILDLCTGSGAIGISLAKYIENCEVWASDISNKAIQIAKLNAEKNLVHKKMNFVESDMFKNMKEKNFDIIVSNPPYIKTRIIKTLPEQVQEEPHIALDGGRDGLNFYRIIINNCIDYLKENGMLFLEIGFDQKQDVSEIIVNTEKYTDLNCIKDFSGNDRVIYCQKSKEGEV